MTPQGFGIPSRMGSQSVRGRGSQRQLCALLYPKTAGPLTTTLLTGCVERSFRDRKPYASAHLLVAHDCSTQVSGRSKNPGFPRVSARPKCGADSLHPLQTPLGTAISTPAARPEPKWSSCDRCLGASDAAGARRLVARSTTNPASDGRDEVRAGTVEAYRSAGIARSHADRQLQPDTKRQRLG